MKAISALCLIFLVAAFALADEKAVQKYRDYTPQQVAAIPAQQRSSELPMMYTLAAQRALAVGSELLFAMELNRLMYPGIHNYAAAVRAFQRDLGDKPTGILTVWQIHNLQQRAEMQQLARILFPESFSSAKTTNFARITGTVVLVDERIAEPINHVRTKCFRQQKTCEVERVYIDVPNENSWAQRFHVLTDETEYYDITRWDEDNIDAVMPPRPNACRTTSLNLNFKTKEFIYITRNAGGDCEILGAQIPKLEKPRIGQIVDGSKIIAEEFAKIEKAAYAVLASEFRGEVEKLVTKSKKP